MPPPARNGFFRAIRRVPQVLLALIVIVAVTASLWPRAKLQPLSAFDQPFYLGIAYDLVHEGRFTNGYFFQTVPPGSPRPSGMRFTPLYPSLLAATSLLDPPFSRAMDCLVHSRGHDAACPREAFLPRLLQFLMLTGFFLLVWSIARQVTASPRVAWIALGLALCTAPDLLGYVNYLMTEITALTMATAATAAGLRGLAKPGSEGWLALAGALAGLAALTRPAFFYLFLVVAAVGLFLAILRAPRVARLRLALAFALAGSVVVAPWIVRNDVVLHEARLTAGYGPQVLVQRIAFDEMSWAEYRLSFLCWLPDGNGMGNLLFGQGACHRFQWADRPDNFYAIGNGPLMTQALAAAGGWPRMLPYLLHTYILPHAFKHVMVTTSLALRGAYITHYWGFFLFPICIFLTIRALRRRDVLFLAATLPGFFMLLFAAAVSVNQPRYNLMLIPAFALSGAIAIDTFLRRRAHRRDAREIVGGR